MQSDRVLVLLGTLLALTGLGGSRAFAATPGFTISATNVTMPASNGSCSDGACTETYGGGVFTLASVDGYAGTVEVSCGATNPPAGAKLPTCIHHPGMGVPLTANASVQGQLLLIPYGQTPPPLPSNQTRGTLGSAGAGLALGGVLLAGLGVRRRTRWLASTMIAVGALAVLTGIQACGGNSNSMTPGTYSYAVTAMDSTTNTSATATFKVTVP